MKNLLAIALLGLTAQAPIPDETIELAEDRAARMTVPVSIGDTGPYPFVIDTGAERTVISRELATTLKLAGDGTARLHSMSGTGNVDTVIIPSLKLSGRARATPSIRAPALARRHLGAAGMIGLDSLQDSRVLLDFGRNTMTVSPSSAPRPERDSDEIVVTARSRHGQLILVDASVGGRKVHAFIDTGSQVSVGNFALQRRLLGKNPKLQPVELISVTGGRTAAGYAIVDSMRISGVTFTDMPIAFADAAPFERLGLSDKPALLIGMDALRLFERVSVDFANKKVRFLLPGDARRGGWLQAGLRGESPPG